MRSIYLKIKRRFEISLKFLNSTMFFSIGVMSASFTYSVMYHLENDLFTLLVMMVDPCIPLANM